MATGDYLVRRNNANTDEVPDAGSDLLLLWDTAYASRGSSITYSAGTFTLGETGRYLVLASEQIGTTDTTNNQRNNAKLTFNLGGTELQEGYGTGYIRRSGGSQECLIQSMAIIEVTSLVGGANDLQVRVERVDTSTAGTVDRVANDRCGVSILKLDDDLNYGRYSGTVTSSSTSGGSVVCTLDTTTEEDGVVFSRTGNNVAITTSNRVLLLTSFKIDETNTDSTRSEYSSFVRDNGNGNTTVENTRIQTYKRGSSTQGCVLGGACIGTVFEPAVGADLQMLMFTHAGAAVAMDVDIMMVELPATCNAVKLSDTNGADFNEVNTQFNWATTDFVDTDAFTVSTPTTDITVDNTGPYLAFANFANRTGSSATRALPAGGFQVNDVTVNIAGHCSFNRNSGGIGNAQMAYGGLLDLTANDTVQTWLDQLGTNGNAVSADASNFVMIEVDTFAPPAPDEPIITGDVEITVVPASTMVVDIQTNPGDYLIRRNASNTDSLPDAGASLDLLWDTEVASQGGIAGYNATTGEFTFYNTGKYLVIFSDQFEVPAAGASSAEDRCWAQEVYIGGTRQQAGASSGWIYNDSGLEENNPSSVSVVDITAINGTANVMKLVAERIDTYTGSNSELDRVADRSGVMIIKLDDTLNYAHYESSADFNTSTGQDAETTANIQTTVEEDGTVFSRTIDVVTVASSNLILGIMTIKTVNAPNAYEEFIGRLELNSSTDIPGSVSVMNVPADRNGSEWGHQSIGFVFEPDGNDTVRIRIATQQGGNGTFSWRASLQLLELPSTVKAIIVQATTGDFNPSSNTNFAWDTNPYIDTDTFTHTAGTAAIEVDSAGDYLAFATMANDSNTSGITTPGVIFTENTTELRYAGGSTSTFNDFGKDHNSPHAGILFTGLSATDKVFATNERLGGTGTNTCDIGAMTVLKLDTMSTPSGAEEYTISGDVTYTFTIASTMVEGRVIDGDSSISLTANSAFAVGRNFTGDSDIVLTPASGMVEGRGIFGDSSIVFTPAADFTVGYTIDGDSSIVFNIASGMVANINAAIDGDSSITLTPDSPTRLTYSINGASLIVVTPASGMAFNQNPSLDGDSDITLTPASTMVEGRALEGDSSIVFNIASGMVANINAVIDGDSSITLTPASSMVEGRGIFGDSSIVFTPAANFEVGYTFTGDSDITLTPASTVVEGRTLDGDSSIVFNIASGMVANINAAIDGDSSITLTPASAMVEGRGIFGDSSIVFTPAADFTVGYTFTGDSSITLTPAADLATGYTFAGDSSITLTPGADFAEGRVIAGDSSIVFTIESDMAFNSGNAIDGDSSIVLTPAATFSVGRSFEGDSSITFSVNGQMVEGRGIFGASTIVFTPASGMDFTSSNTIQGDVTIVLTPESDTAVGYTLSGDSAIVLTPTADTAVERTVDGDSTITLTANSAFAVGRAIAGDSSVVLTPDSATSVGRDVQGDSAITFDINADMEFNTGNQINGDSSITLTPEATVVKSLSFTGDSSITLTPDSALGFGNEFEGDSSITVTPASEMKVGRIRIGDSSITFTPASGFNFTQNPALTGNSTITLVPASNLQYIPERGLVGNSTITLTPKTFAPLPSFCIKGISDVVNIGVAPEHIETVCITTLADTVSIGTTRNELVSIQTESDIIVIKSIDD